MNCPGGEYSSNPWPRSRASSASRRRVGWPTGAVSSASEKRRVVASGGVSSSPDGSKRCVGRSTAASSGLWAYCVEAILLDYTPYRIRRCIDQAAAKMPHLLVGHFLCCLL